MSWTHSSKGVVLAVLLAVSLLSVGTAAALSVSAEEAPDETQVGEQVSMTITIEEPFADAPSQWTLQGDSELENASWTVTTLEQGRTLETREYGSATFEQDLNIDNGATEIEITVEGTTPDISEFNYEDIEMEEFKMASVGRATNGNVNTIESWEVHRYTEESREARQEIEDAEAAVSEASSEDAESLLEDAKAFYDGQEPQFDRAISNAEDARERAEQASGGLPLIPIIGVVLVLVVVVGGVFYYRSQQQSSGHKLQ